MKGTTMTLMRKEACYAPEAVAKLIGDQLATIEALADHLRRQESSVIATVARGSSDHAANYFGYLAMSRLGKLVCSVPMSLVTLQQAPLAVREAFVLAISQSGQGPDVIQTMRHFVAQGAPTAAFINDPQSPLAQAVGTSIDLCAGPETSVAATKSFISSLAASALLVACWQSDDALLAAVRDLPDALRTACQTDWSAGAEVLVRADRIMVVGRGLGLSVALEAALKCKETSALQAEAFSGAEIVHGPMAMIEAGYPLLVFATEGPEKPGLIQLAADMRERGAHVLLAAADDVPQRTLTLPTAPSSTLSALCAIQSFYLMIEQVALARGLNPDVPRHLNKITKTL